MRPSAVDARSLRRRLDADAALMAVTILAVLWSPLLGLGLAVLGAWDRHRKGNVAWRNAFIVVAAVDIALFIAVST